MRLYNRAAIGIAAVVTLSAGQGGCGQAPSAATQEQAQQDVQMEQFLRNQPIPSFNWSLERHLLIQIYTARQGAVATYSFVQSEYTGKVLWSCPSIGFPLPYSTQLTNPQQMVTKRVSNDYHVDVLAQQEPNGLFTPQTSEATWVPCVDASGKIIPVYEEHRVSVFPRPMTERDGQLVPTGAPASAALTIDPRGGQR